MSLTTKSNGMQRRACSAISETFNFTAILSIGNKPGTVTLSCKRSIDGRPELLTVFETGWG